MLLQETAWWLSLVFLIGDKLVVGIENALVTINSRIVGKPEVIRFIRHAARWRRFFRSSLAASNF
jgi:hypothetical protein